MRIIKGFKVRGSSLVETIVSTVIIIVVFGIASLTLQNLMQSTFSSNTSAIENEMNKLKYLYEQGIINENYQGSLKNWEISVMKSSASSDTTIRLLAKEKKIKTGENSLVKTIKKNINHAH